MLATGGGGGDVVVVNLWHDSTVEDKEEAFRKEEEGVLKGQELENALSDANYIKAIKIAFELRRPHKLFDLFSELFRKNHAEDQVDKALQSLGTDEQYQLFEYVREWNSKPKLCSVAQFVLSRVFSTLPPKEIIETIESLNLLKMRNTEFIAALKKVDRLCGWKTCKNKPIVKAMKQQSKDGQVEFNWRLTQ
ncbi:hypothetical protein MKX03_009591, partial [Papaver bracteatum]